MSQSNPRKRNAPSMLFQRALFGLNKNNGNPSGNSSSTPPRKRARVVMDGSSASNQAFSDSQSSSSSNHRHHHHSKFSHPPPKEPTRNFLHDHHRDHNRSKYGHNNKAIRHTPETRFSQTRHTKNGYAQKQSYHFNTNNNRKHRQNHHRNHRYNNYNNNNHHHQHHHNHRNNYDNDESYQLSNNYNKNGQQAKYQKVELNRMRKLWTDFATQNESILTELRFCRDTSFFITSNSIAHKMSLVLKLILSEYYKAANIECTDDTPIKILDGLSCIGGNTYSFAKIFSSLNHEIYANELNTARYNALKHNMNIFQHHQIISNHQESANKSRFHFYNLDFLKLHETLGSEVCDAMDIIFLDPEWNNGDDYKQTNREQIHLFNIGPLHLYQVVNNIITEWYTNAKIIAIKVAKNYDQEFLCRKFQKCKAIETKQFRMGEISFHNQKLLVIVKEFAEDKDHGDGKDEDDDIGGDHKFESSFEMLLECLPDVIDQNNASNHKDRMNVKLLS